ncbi:MAG: serine/threonine protein kinase [Planctomycetaceae bacterium]|nr:serine/threonine protein kinase [Planctomycetaceae bacterium]
MSEPLPEKQWTAEKFAQRVFDIGVLDNIQVDSAWSELGTRDASLEQLTSVMLRKGLLTNWQIDRVLAGERYGYIYGKYQIRYLVGAGTFARVYRGSHVETGKVVAIKVLRNRHSDDMEKQDHFLREANMVKELRHPNIVPVYDFGAERERYYMVMEFVEGDDLREILKKRGKFNPLESIQIISDVTSGLDFAVGKGVTHRDMKMSNVLLTSTGRGKLVDFGLAAMAASEKEKNAKKTGVITTSSRSIDYAGLERMTRVHKGDKRSDIYFAGCMLYHLLTGVSPLLESRERSERLSATRFREVTPLTQHDADLPPSLIAVVNKAMDLNVERRYQTPGEMLSDLHKVKQRLEHGETAAEEGEGKKLDREGEGRSVMIVESNIEMQDTLRDLLKRRGYRVLIVGDAERALGRFDGIEQPAECVIFCTTEMAEEALDAFNSFGENEDTKDIPAILFLSERHQEYARKARGGEHRVLLPMPLKVRQLRAILLKLLSNSGKSVDA